MTFMSDAKYSSNDDINSFCWDITVTWASQGLIKGSPPGSRGAVAFKLTSWSKDVQFGCKVGQIVLKWNKAGEPKSTVT